MPAEEEVGVVDRVIGDIAVVLVGEEAAEYEVPATSLPEAAREGSWLRVRREGASVVVVGRNEAGEAEQRRSVEDRLGRLRAQRKGDRFR